MYPPSNTILMLRIVKVKTKMQF